MTCAHIRLAVTNYHVQTANCQDSDQDLSSTARLLGLVEVCKGFDDGVKLGAVLPKWLDLTKLHKDPQSPSWFLRALCGGDTGLVRKRALGLVYNLPKRQ